MRLRVQINKKLFLDYPTKLAPEDFKTFISGFLEWQCEKIKERIKEVVKTQSYKWEPLSDSWKAFKSSYGMDPKIWIASGQVLDSIIYWYDALGDQYIIGIHPTLKHRAYMKGGRLDWSRKGARIIDIVRWMELGTPNMPARPLFTKVLEEFKKKSKQTALYAEYIKLQKGLI